jgi:NTE family protein
MKTALVLSGGGARSAYQVGVLKAINDILPTQEQNPFQIICGTSSGAINAVKLASQADHFPTSVLELQRLWLNLRSEHIHKVGYRELIHSALKLFFAFFRKGVAYGRPLSLFDNTPLSEMLNHHIDFERIGQMIEQDYLRAVGINALGYSSGNNICFFQGHESLAAWQRSRRLGVPTNLQLSHLLASSALPMLFPAIKINREYFGDGAIRQTAPISPALHLGADKLFVIGVSGNPSKPLTRKQSKHSPSISDIATQLLNSAFIDSLEEDVHMLQRFNRFAEAIEPAKREALQLKAVELLVVEPSIEFDALAADFTHCLPRSMKRMLKTIGANTQGETSSFASYVLFEGEFAKALIDAGYKDGFARKEEIRQFLGSCKVSES